MQRGFEIVQQALEGFVGIVKLIVALADLTNYIWLIAVQRDLDMNAIGNDDYAIFPF